MTLLDGGDVLDQPHHRGVEVGDGALPKPEQLPDLGAVPHDRAARPLVEPQIRRRHPQLLRDERDDLVRQLRAAAREPCVLDEELPQQRERQPVRPVLAAAPLQLATDQRPPLDQLILIHLTGHAGKLPLLPVRTMASR